MIYAKLFNRKQTPQSEPIPLSGQVQNNAGGYAFEVDAWTVLDRFLILGSEAGTYYVNPQKLTQENVSTLLDLIRKDGVKVVQRIVEISVTGRAPKNDPAIFALSLCASFGNDATRAEALRALSTVCRTGSHLFQFAEAVDGLRGWGRGLRRAVGNWYNGKSIAELELQLIKYQRREGWSNRDLLRLSHPVPSSEAHRDLFKWAVSGEGAPAEAKRVAAMEALKSASPAEAAQIIVDVRLPREAVPTELLKEQMVWEALLCEMPMTAMIRNLATMTRIGLLAPGSEATKTVVERLGNEARIKGARVHPMAMLIAQRTYAAGRSQKSAQKWTPVPAIVDALDAGFYLAFRNVDPSNKRFLLGVDVSGSMAGPVAGAGMMASEAATAMAMVTMSTEEAVTPMAFSDQFRPLGLSRRTRLDDAMKATRGFTFGRTDCSLPMQYALKQRMPVDVFVVYTDNETWYGDIHPVQALRRYRDNMGIDAKLAVVALTATKFSIADPKDAGMLDVVGFDATVPQVLSQFVSA